MAGIYIHIPFCKQACYYCDFHFSTNQKNKTQLCGAIAKELELQQHYLGGEDLHTVYFGGGTPSLLNKEELSLIFESIKNNFPAHTIKECTLEANPDDLTIPVLQMLHAHGINRLSIGIQSFDDTILKSLNRAHTSAQAKTCVAHARAAGFDNISCDLIYAIPGLSDTEWKKSIQKMLELGPEHISAYSLTIEEKTVFGNWLKNGKLNPMEDDLAGQQLEILVDMLTDQGYEQYEVSNFAKPKYQAIHNTNYWKQEKYLGVGPSAHSFNTVSRQFNVSNNAKYLQAIESGVVPFTLEMLSKEDRINEYVLTTLRTKWGSNLKWIKEEFAYDLHERNSQYIEQLLESGLATLQDHFLILTKKGMMLGDKIASDLFLIAP